MNTYRSTYRNTYFEYVLLSTYMVLVPPSLLLYRYTSPPVFTRGLLTIFFTLRIFY